MDLSNVRLRTIVLALLCLAVLAFGASTLDSTTDPGSGLGAGGGSGAGSGGDESTPTGGPIGDDDEDERPSPFFDFEGSEGSLLQFCVEWLTGPLALFGLLLGLVAIFLLLRWRYDFLIGLAAVTLIAYPGLFVYIALTACGDRSLLPDIGPPTRPTADDDGFLSGAEGVTSPSLSTQILFVVVLLTLVVVALLVLTSDHDQTETDSVSEAEADDEEDGGAVSVAALGAVAGRAADRIEEADEDADFENEVYRAWAEMTDHLSVDRPDSSTPGEFATAAVSAGMDRDDVDQLTELFEAVRYGGFEPTREREREAVDSLRRIEATYAGDEA